MRRNRVRNAVQVQLRCLIVDDSETFLAAARRLLESQDIALVGVATSGAEAVQLVRELRPDVALIDIELADESGGDVAREIHEITNGKTAVILISAHADGDVADLVGETPAVAFIPKARLSTAAVLELVRSGS